ncbi:MAG: carboxypeptidase-like regulatory domain-containing protein [Bacteroidota bacterium]
MQLAAFGGNSDKEKASGKVVAGKITDASGEAIAGTKICIKETGETFFADLEGNFKISLKSDQVYSISIQTIGYQPKELKSSDLSLFSELSLTEL